MPSAVVAGIAVAVILAAQAIALAALGHITICSCGYVKLWHGAVDTQNSQHLLDWYTFSHIGHGILFMLVVWGMRRASALARRIPLSVWLVVWVGVEAAWEVLENTPRIIELYRTNPISKHYFGDSIINSLGDTLAMIGGFLFAARVGVIAALTLFVGMELWTHFTIGDSLIANILFFLTAPYGAS